AGTLAAIGHLASEAGYIFRVHDVAQVRDYLAVAAGLSRRAGIPGGPMPAPPPPPEPHPNPGAFWRGDPPQHPHIPGCGGPPTPSAPPARRGRWYGCHSGRASAGSTRDAKPYRTSCAIGASAWVSRGRLRSVPRSTSRTASSPTASTTSTSIEISTA